MTHAQRYVLQCYPLGKFKRIRLPMGAVELSQMSMYTELFQFEDGSKVAISINMAKVVD